MENQRRTAIVIGASSDIGGEFCRQWSQREWSVVGTYRSPSSMVTDLQGAGVKLVHCDLADTESIKSACVDLKGLAPSWDLLVMSPGIQDPIGKFIDCDFDEWENSVKVNFSSQLRIIHSLLPHRRTSPKGDPPTVLLFAGGGTNNAPLNYSAYIASKIGLTKMTELLDAEVPDTRFLIVGPGWVKIHQSTLDAGKRAGDNYERTVEKLRGNDCTPMDVVFKACEALIGCEKKLVGGRNFSVVFDQWGSEELNELLRKNPDYYKLRRLGNGVLERTSF